MSKPFRRIIFYTLVLVFLVAGAVITLYAKGIRWNGDNFALTNIGGMYVVPSPNDAAITLDGKPIKRNSGIFQSGTLVSGLFPKTHILELSRQGYKPWRRSVTVEPSKVAEIPYAVLVPEQPSASLGSNTRAFWLLHNDPLLQVSTTTFTFRDSAVASNGIPVSWSPNGFLAHNATANTYSLVNMADATSTPLRTLLARLGREGTVTSTVVRADSLNDDKFFVLAEQSLTVGDIQANTLTPIARAGTSTILSAFEASERHIAWSMFKKASSTSEIFLYDRFSRQVNFIGNALPGKTRLMRWGDGTMLAIVQDNGDLYIYDRDAERMVKKAGGVRDVFFTGDGKKIAALGQSLEIIPFDPRKQADYARFNIANIENVNRITWYRADYSLFIHYADRVVLLDGDDARQENIITVATTTMSAYDAESNKFYYLNGDKVSVLQFSED